MGGREGGGGQAVGWVLLRGRSAPRGVAPKQQERARGVEWASVSADLRGSLATRGVAPKQQEGSPACFLSGISGGIPLSLGAWVPKNLRPHDFTLVTLASRMPSSASKPHRRGAASCA